MRSHVLPVMLDVDVGITQEPGVHLKTFTISLRILDSILVHYIIKIISPFDLLVFPTLAILIYIL